MALNTLLESLQRSFTNDPDVNDAVSEFKIVGRGAWNTYYLLQLKHSLLTGRLWTMLSFLPLPLRATSINTALYRLPLAFSHNLTPLQSLFESSENTPIVSCCVISG